MIGCPMYGDVSPRLLEDWMRWAFHLGRRMPEFEFSTSIVTKKEQFRARNAIADAALQQNCDWVLMIDDDMIINHLVTSDPTDDYDFLRKLIAHDKDICGVLYYQRHGECAPVLMRKMTEKGYRFLRDDEVEHGLQRVDVAGGGCLLIKARVFDRLRHPYFEPEFRFGTDIQLCRQAAEKGFEVWADTSIELGHLREEETVITSRNRLQYQMTDQVSGEVKKSFIAADIYSRLIQDAEAYTGKSRDEMVQPAMTFINGYHDFNGSDADWYRQFPEARIWRQVIFNIEREDKRQMTEFILASIDNKKKLDILDFGCGIGIPAFTFAEKGHRVTAMDIAGTGTLEFLKSRAQKHGVSMQFADSAGGAPALTEQYDAIIAMDSIEHIKDWPTVVAELASHLKPGGLLFANNAILEDTKHPEHYVVDGKEFVKQCLDAGLMPINQITFVKKGNANAKNTDSVSESAVHAIAG